MPTDEERREVAEILSKTRIERYNSILNGIHLGESIRVGAQIVSPHEDQVRAAADRLADLIEPEPERTCRMEYAGEVPPSVRYSCYFCSECGSPIYNDMEPSYCPYCGAKVVSE